MTARRSSPRVPARAAGPRSSGSRASTAKAPKAAAGTRPPELLHLPGLALIWGVALGAALLGVVIVDMRFQAADRRIETTRLQRESQVLRDDSARMQARLGAMRGGTHLRDRAITHLGMVEPDPSRVERIQVDPFRVKDFREAERAAIADAARERRQQQERATRPASGLLAGIPTERGAQ